jgi:hypothetical protein
LVAADGTIPQNISWDIASGDASKAEGDLFARLSALPIGSVTILDADGLPSPMARAAARLDAGIDRVAAPDVLVTRPVVRGALRALPECAVPRVTRASGVLAIVGFGGERDDISLLSALARTVHRRKAHPCLIVAGEIAPDEAAVLPDNLFFSGGIADEELPGWIGHIGAQAVFFVSRRWSPADPRAFLWAEADVPVARFDGRETRHAKKGRSIILAGHPGPDALARVVAGWMAEQDRAVSR